MSSTPFQIYGRQTDFTFFEGEHHLPVFRNLPEEILSSEKVKQGYLDIENLLSLVSDKKKIFISPEGAFFHLFSDTLAPLFQQLELDKDVEVIVNISKISNPMFTTNQTEFTDNSFTGFFIKVLKDRGISVKLINKNYYDAININNFYINDYKFYVGDTYSALFNAFSRYVNDSTIEPYRKAYLSRKRIPSRIEVFTDSSKREVMSNDNRLDNEELLENYFKDLGYEIVCPEDFESFQDQLDYMYSVKTLVSVSSSGLSNSIFMQPSQTVVELVTPLQIPFDDENNPYGSILIQDLHHFYSTMAFKKSHKYIALSNEHKKSSEIINQIEKDPTLKNFLSSM